MASQNRRKNRGKGKPFEPGKMPRAGKPFKKGQSGNPGGRPSTAWIREYLAELASPGAPPRKQAIIQALWLTAIERRHKDHVRAAELLLAYDVGKPVQAIEVSGPEGGPIDTGDGGLRLLTSEAANRRLRELLQKAAGPPGPPEPAAEPAPPEPEKPDEGGK